MRRKKTIIKKKQKKKTVTKAKDVAAVRATHALKARHLSAICAEIECQRCIASGRIPRGVITKALEANKPIYTWLTIDLIKKALKKSKGTLSASLETISDLTEATTADNTVDTANNIPPPSTIGFDCNVMKKKRDAQKVHLLKLHENIIH
jgi:hypothetical protein